MRAIVKPWNEIKSDAIFHNPKLKINCGKIINGLELDFYGEFYELPDSQFYYHESWLDFINEDEWDAEIYALLLIESGVIYE